MEFSDSLAKQLLNAGHKRRGLAGVIADRMDDVSEKIVSRVLRKAGI